MFSLIITIISIVLVGLLAVATIYYGGDSFSNRGPEAQAATILNQGQQISGAMELWHVDGKGSLGVMSSLTSTAQGAAYLSDIPAPPNAAYTSNTANASDWILLNPSASRSSFMLQQKVKKEVCHWVNFKAYGDGDIRESVDPRKLIQCFGTAEPFTVLFGLGTGSAPLGGGVTPASIPPSLENDVQVFNDLNTDPLLDLIVLADGGIVSFEDTSGLRTTTASVPSGGNPSTGGGTTPTSVDPSFTPSGPIVVAYNPTTKSLSLALPLVSSDFDTGATYQASTGFQTIDGVNTITEYSMQPVLLGRTPITNSTNAYLRLGAIPLVTYDMTPLGSPVSNFPVVFDAANGLSLMTSYVDTDFSATSNLFAGAVKGQYPSPAAFSGMCAAGQTLAPGQSCDIGFASAQDAMTIGFLTGLGLPPLPTGYNVPFTWGDSAASISPANSGQITVGTP